MDISKYTKLLDKIARNIKNGKLKPSEIAPFVEKELGVKFRDIDVEADTKKSLEEMELEQKQDKFFRDNRELYNAFKTIFEILHNSKTRQDAFSIKFNSFKLVETYEVLKKHKNSPLYNKVLLFTIAKLKHYFPEIVITPEMVKVLKTKYIP